MASYNHQQGQPNVNVYYASPATVPTGYAANYSKTTSTTLGVFLIILSIVSLTGGIMALVYEAHLADVGVGFWCGASYFITGVVAIAAGQHPTNKLVSGTALCSGLTIAFGITQVVVASVGIDYDVLCIYGNYEVECVTWKEAAVAANCLMVAAGSWSIIFAVWLFAISCRAVKSSRKHPQVVTTTAVPVGYTATRTEAIVIHPTANNPSQQAYFQQQHQPYPGPSNPYAHQQQHPYNPYAGGAYGQQPTIYENPVQPTIYENPVQPPAYYNAGGKGH